MSLSGHTCCNLADRLPSGVPRPGPLGTPPLIGGEMALTVWQGRV